MGSSRLPISQARAKTRWLCSLSWSYSFCSGSFGSPLPSRPAPLLGAGARHCKPAVHSAGCPGFCALHLLPLWSWLLSREVPSNPKRLLHSLRCLRLMRSQQAVHRCRCFCCHRLLGAHTRASSLKLEDWMWLDWFRIFSVRYETHLLWNDMDIQVMNEDCFQLVKRVVLLLFSKYCSRTLLINIISIAKNNECRPCILSADTNTSSHNRPWSRPNTGTGLHVLGAPWSAPTIGMYARRWLPPSNEEAARSKLFIHHLSYIYVNKTVIC